MTHLDPEPCLTCGGLEEFTNGDQHLGWCPDCAGTDHVGLAHGDCCGCSQPSVLYRVDDSLWCESCATIALGLTPAAVACGQVESLGLLSDYDELTG